MTKPRLIAASGRKYEVLIEADDDAAPPWEREDGHGPVSAWTTRDKIPGERVLNSEGGAYRYYDFAEACRIAKKDGWGISNPSKSATPKQIAALAVLAAEADYAYLRAWCNDEWRYVGVIVRPVCTCCGTTMRNDYRFALWGIEDDAGDYLDQVALELIDDAEADLGPVVEDTHDNG